MSALREQRVRAAEYSGGISSAPIHRLALTLFQDLPLANDLLEFGPGKGHFIGELLTQGYRGAVTGADLLPRPPSLPESVRWIETDLNDPLPLPGQSFDAIVCMEVIAHLENPRALFREFSRLLRPNGALLLTMPNQESLRSLLGLFFGGHFATFRGIAYPALITALLRKDLERICDETGFHPPRFYYTDSGLVPKLHVSWQRLTLGLLKGRVFSDNLALVARKM
jgi:2-polyprenyl-3-methyl-5-hydroxy-6-metoxy-1,4-benzoquinol methylase